MAPPDTTITASKLSDMDMVKSEMMAALLELDSAKSTPALPNLGHFDTTGGSRLSELEDDEDGNIPNWARESITTGGKNFDAIRASLNTLDFPVTGLVQRLEDSLTIEDEEKFTKEASREKIVGAFVDSARGEAFFQSCMRKTYLAIRKEVVALGFSTDIYFSKHNFDWDEVALSKSHSCGTIALFLIRHMSKAFTLKLRGSTGKVVREAASPTLKSADPALFLIAMVEELLGTQDLFTMKFAEKFSASISVPSFWDEEDTAIAAQRLSTLYTFVLYAKSNKAGPNNSNVTCPARIETERTVLHF